LSVVAAKTESARVEEPKVAIAGRDTIDPVVEPAVTKPIAAPIPNDTVLRLPLKHVAASIPADVRPIPYITGMTLRDAVRVMHEAGFRVALSNGSVLSVSPAAGSLAPAGSLVRIYRPK
jgi:hypothetical protein